MIRLRDLCTGDEFTYETPVQMYEELRNAASDEDRPAVWKLCSLVQENLDGLVNLARVNRYARTQRFEVTTSKF